MIAAIRSLFSVGGASDSRVKRILGDICTEHTNTVFVGDPGRSIADKVLDLAPRAEHYFLEPHPLQLNGLTHRYTDFNTHFIGCCASAAGGTQIKTYKLPVTVKNNKTGKEEIRLQDQQVTVTISPLDELLPPDYTPTLLIVSTGTDVDKIIAGAAGVIARSELHIVLRKGMGMVPHNTHNDIYITFAKAGLRVSTPGRWLSNKPSFRQNEFEAKVQDTPATPLIIYP